MCMSRGEGRIHVFESCTHLLTTVGHHPQCFGDAHDPARIGQYNLDWRFGRHLMLCAEHDHIFRIYFPV